MAPALQHKPPGQRGHGGAFQRFLHTHGRQQPGKALGQHAFARTGWPGHQQAVAACGGNFQRPARGRLAFHIGHVRVGAGVAGRAGLHPHPAVGVGGLGGGVGLVGRKSGHHVSQVAGAVHLGAIHQRCFFRAARGQHQLDGLGAGFALHRQAHGQCAPNGPQLSAQRQLARQLPALQLGQIHLTAGRQQAYGQRQVKPARIFGQVGRRQVDGDAFVARKFQARLGQRRTHAFAGFFDFGVRQADQREAGQTVGQMHLDPHGPGFEPLQRTAVDDSKRHKWCSFPELVRSSVGFPGDRPVRTALVRRQRGRCPLCAS